MHDFLSVADVAERLNVSEKLVRNEMDRGRIPFKKFGRLIRIPASALDRYLLSATGFKEPLVSGPGQAPPRTVRRPPPAKKKKRPANA